MTYHVVVSSGSVVLAVYGDALLSDAQSTARRIERETGMPAYVQQVRVRSYRDRPRVGQLYAGGG